ncbi:MAG: hypothetical protein COC24_016925 [Alphaproteobacteria bacterium]|nr:hypothetical protein [Alphaproteobacteria bacterium]
MDIWVKSSNCKFPFQNPEISLAIFTACLLCFLVTLTVLSVVKMNNSVKITSIKYIPSELMNYTLPYVVSFMGIGYGEGDKFVGIIIFLAWIFWITHKSGQVILNPILVAFGWRLHEISYRFPENETEHTSTALIKGDFLVDDSVGHNWVQDVMIIKKVGTE